MRFSLGKSRMHISRTHFNGGIVISCTERRIRMTL